jgi:probable addiction module antidote protein
MGTIAMALKTYPFDAARYLKSEAAIEAFLEDIFEDGNPQVIAEGLGAVARARGMSKVAKATGLTREGLYKALSNNGNPELATILKVVKALGFQLTAKAVA